MKIIFLISSNLLSIYQATNNINYVQSHSLSRPAFSHGLLCIFLYIAHKISQCILSHNVLKHVNYFTLLSTLLKYSFSIRIMNLDHFYFQWSASQEEHAKIIWVGLSNPTPNIRKAMPETEVTDQGRCQYNISFLIMSNRVCYPFSNKILVKPLST